MAVFNTWLLTFCANNTLGCSNSSTGNARKKTGEHFTDRLSLRNARKTTKSIRAATKNYFHHRFICIVSQSPRWWNSINYSKTQRYIVSYQVSGSPKIDIAEAEVSRILVPSKVDPTIPTMQLNSITVRPLLPAKCWCISYSSTQFVTPAFC